MDGLTEVSYTKLNELINNQNLVVVLAHTPTCGTCAVAKKMLYIIGKTLESIPIVQINLNYYSEFAQQEEIFSVPCVLIFKEGRCIEKVYTLESVPHMYKKITSYL